MEKKKKAWGLDTKPKGLGPAFYTLGWLRVPCSQPAALPLLPMYVSPQMIKGREGHLLPSYLPFGLPWWLSGKESAC